MIDSQNGDVVLSQGFRLGASTTRAQFLASAIGRDAKVFVQNEPHCSYRAEAVMAGGERFLVMPFFHGETMEAIWLCVIDGGFSGCQDTIQPSEKTERSRKEWHDRWLNSVLGAAAPSRFSWGQAASVFDPRSMSSQIVIRYGGSAPESTARPGEKIGG
jgi:hypothetical protein